MRTYPDYYEQPVKRKGPDGRRVTVTLKADTRCGPRIEAHSTVTATQSTTDSIEDAYAEALRVAKRNLRIRHEAVVTTCKKNGTHHH